MKLYTIYGEKNAGKTTFIKRILKCIVEKNKDYRIVPCYEIVSTQGLKDKGSVKRCIQNIQDSIDNIARCHEAIGVLEIGEKRIGIYTIGDAHFNLRDAIYYFIAHDCDVAFNASHTSKYFCECIEATCETVEKKFSAHIKPFDVLKECGKDKIGIRDLTDKDISDIVEQTISI